MNKPVDQQEWVYAMAAKVASDGPQTLAADGVRLTVMSETEFRLLSGRKPTFLEALRGLGDISDLDLSRDPSPAREIDF
ncbi:MAG: type II toxin-antitoxin system prevent-host-death family antitoxin [Pseudomonadota bacterium]